MIKVLRLASAFVMLGLVTACGTPQATVKKIGANTYLLQVTKGARSPFVLTEVQAVHSESKNSQTTTARTTTENGAKAVLNPKGYDAFGIVVEAPGLAFTPTHFVVRYKKSNEGSPKAFVAKKWADASGN